MNIKFHSLVLCGLSISFGSVVSAYDLHEWGTFTTVSGSDGSVLSGLHVEEEKLPDFVYSHIGMRPQAANGSYAMMLPPLMPNLMNRYDNQMFVMKDAKGKIIPAASFKGIPQAMLQNVTVKMETPVIYFYGDDTPKVNVKVGFNGGTISQWYPNRTSGDTPNLIKVTEEEILERTKKSLSGKQLVLHQPIDFSKPYNGSIEWDVDIIPKAEADPAYTFKSNENHTWIYPRVPDANMVKVGDEYEDYLFYRGVGNFELPATFRVDASETLHVKNNSKEAIPFAFAFENIAGKFRYKTIGEITVGSEATVAEDEWVSPSGGESQQVAVFQEVRDGLLAQGLTRDEANGMVKTWWKSYFEKDGLRVFWVVPQTDVERILPLTVTPKPENQVRVLVGRADVLRPKFEQEMITNLGTHAFRKYTSDRFYQPYRERLSQLIKSPVFQKFDKENIVNTHLKITGVKGDSKMGERLYLSDEKEVKLQHLQLGGKWEIIGDDQLKIGDTLFTLDPEKGLLTAKVDSEKNFDVYEIQLPKVLN